MGFRSKHGLTKKPYCDYSVYYENIIFISDLHIDCSLFANNVEYVKNQVKDSLEKLNFDKTKDLIVILGDIVDKGDKKSMCCVKEVFKPVMGDDWDINTNVVCVPGNHDVSVFKGVLPPCHRSYYNFSKFFYTDTCVKVDEGGILNIFKKEDKKNFFPCVIDVNEKMVLILLDSNQRQDPHFSHGRLGETQVNELTSRLDEIRKDKKIVTLAMHHHPIPTLKNSFEIGIIEDWEYFHEKVIEKYCDIIKLVFFGHRHSYYEKDFFYHGRNVSGFVKYVNIGSLSHPSTKLSEKKEIYKISLDTISELADKYISSGKELKKLCLEGKPQEIETI